MRTYVRMTSDGSAYARFRRALETGNEVLVLGAARELPQIALDDALRICLVLRDGDRARYDRAAVRWLGRFALEARAVMIRDLRAAAAALDAPPIRSANRWRVPDARQAGRLAGVTADDVMVTVERALDRYVASGHLPGYVAGVDVDGETAICAAGTLALGSDDPMDRQTIFRIASLSKIVGGVLALTLVQDGTIRLDDEVGRWLPELAAPRVLRAPGSKLDDTVPARRPILVSDLLTMTAGFGLPLGDSPLRAAMIANGLMPGPLAP